MKGTIRHAFAGTVAVLALLLCVLCNRRDAQAPPPPPAPTVSHAPAGRPRSVQDPTPPGTNASVFALSYRGITSEEPELWAGSATGWGSGDSEDNKYLERLKKRIKIRPVYNPRLSGREWSALELEGDEVVALHVDLNGNQEPDDDERILPSRIPESHYLSRSKCKLFFTPDMQLPGEEEEPEPYRLVLRVDPGSTGCPMWSGASLWTGSGEIDGVGYDVLLRDGSLHGGFRTFGRAQFDLRPSGESEEKARPRWHSLSRIIYHGERFMRLRFLGNESREEDFRLILDPYEGATGKLRMELLGADGDKLPATCSYARLKGESDPDVYFGFPVTNDVVEAPSAQYTITYAKLSYGTDAEAWTCRLKEYSGVTVGEGDTRTLPLGPLSLAVVAVDANRRYSSDVKPATEFAAEKDAYISPEVTGPNGETFSQFSAIKSGGRARKASHPSLRITDAQGNEIVATTLEYG